jgi:acyl carrier protein
MKKTKEQIQEELKNLLLKIIDVEPEELKPNADFFKDLGVDSIKAIEIAVAIEKYFKVPINEDAVGEITTLAKATDAIFGASERG